MFVRSLTILLVEEETLNQFEFLAIGSLAITMLVDVFVHVPEVVTGLIGAFIIAISVLDSVRRNQAVNKN